MLTFFSCSACRAFFPYLSKTHWEIPIWQNPKCFMNVYWFYPNLQMKSFGKMGQLALSPASCFSNLPWFPGGSPLPHLATEVLVLPGPIAPSQVSWRGGRRHHPGPCLSCCALLTPRMSVQRAAAYVIWLSCPLGSLAFWCFFPVSWIKKKEKCWLTMDAFLLTLKQHNAVKFCNLSGCFFFSNFDAR